jgi:O-antigen/teichoic acid export membrane protein
MVILIPNYSMIGAAVCSLLVLVSFVLMHALLISKYLQGHHGDAANIMLATAMLMMWLFSSRSEIATHSAMTIVPRLFSEHTS